MGAPGSVGSLLALLFLLLIHWPLRAPELSRPPAGSPGPAATTLFPYSAAEPSSPGTLSVHALRSTCPSDLPHTSRTPYWRFSSLSLGWRVRLRNVVPCALGRAQRLAQDRTAGSTREGTRCPSLRDAAKAAGVFCTETLRISVRFSSRWFCCTGRWGEATRGSSAPLRGCETPHAFVWSAQVRLLENFMTFETSGVIFGGCWVFSVTVWFCFALPWIELNRVSPWVTFIGHSLCSRPCGATRSWDDGGCQGQQHAGGETPGLLHPQRLRCLWSITFWSGKTVWQPP